MLPLWAFLLVALYLYFIPWFRPGKLAAPFFVLLALAGMQPASPSSPSGLLFGLIFGGIFYVMLLVKDLLILDRRSAYEIIVLALAFFLLRDFYQVNSTGVGGWALFGAFLVSAAIALILRSFLHGFPEEAAESWRLKRTSAWLAFLLIAQLCITVLFLPLDFAYQSAIVFLATVLIVDLAAEHAFAGPAGLSRGKVLGVASTVLVLLALLLSSAQWRL